MSENKKLIIVDITDKEYTQLDVKSDLVSIKGDGKVFTKNTSQKSRLWNLTNNLKEIINTNIPDKVLNIDSLNPGEEHLQEYEIQNLKEPCLKVIEVFDAGREMGDIVNNAFLFERSNQCSLKLIYQNIIDKPITEIKSKREMPEFLHNIEISPPNLGKVELIEDNGKKSIRWDIGTLKPNETAELNLICMVTMSSRDKQSLGALNITYLVRDHQRTMINPEVRSLTNSISGITRDEGLSPKLWDCNIEFNNESEFEVMLEDVKVEHVIPTGAESVVTQTQNTEVHAESSWDYDFKIESKEVPKLNFAIEFTVLFEVFTRVIGEINKESTIYDVLASEITKSINPPEVGAYANTNIQINNTISNTGTASIDTLEIIDEIPIDIIPQKTDLIKLILKKSETQLEIQDRTEYVDKIIIDPDDKNPETPHKILISLKDLRELLTPEAVLIMDYGLIAKNPKPDVRYYTPVQIKVNTPIKGAIFEISTPEEPVIQIRYIQRKLKTLKSIMPGANKGEFNISIRIENKGDVELENITVQDLIPSGFSLSEFTPPEDTTFENIQKDNESELKVKINVIEGNKTINISYICSGSGEYPRSEPEITVLGRSELSALDKLISKNTPQGTSEESVEKPPEVVLEVAPDIEISPSLLIKIHNFFSAIYKKMDTMITVSDLITNLDDDDMLDIFPQGSIRQEYSAFLKEFHSIEDKTLKIFGPLQDKLKGKIQYFENRFK